MMPTFEELSALKLTRTRLISLKQKYPDFFNEISVLYPNLPASEQIYHYFNPNCRCTCKVCGGSVKYINMIQGYKKYCSIACSRKDPESNEKRKQTCLEKYGCENPAQSKEIQARMEETCLKRYGVRRATESEEITNKIKQNNLKKYGVINPSSLPEVRIKVAKTNMKRYGATVPIKNPKIKQRIIETTRKKYGGMGNSSEIIKSRVYQTCLERYGCEMPGGLPEFQAKARKTKKERYGISCYTPISPISQKCFKKLDKIFYKYKTEYGDKCGEHYVRVNKHSYYLDYFVPELQLCVEFFGSTWHGNPEIYKAKDYCIPACKSITASEIWKRDKRRIDNLKSIGITTIIIWDTEYKKCQEFDDLKKLLFDKLSEHNIYIKS